jgi:hypothetical protein
MTILLENRVIIFAYATCFDLNRVIYRLLEIKKVEEGNIKLYVNC